ncbi:hypothetical protein [Haloprofundus salinisoli]|uniref:hypothetical protein n=1 Tax=Haloprofundus salinisoli TaxID=2876193 RepID=UPI001CCF2FE8|nr:hypothetical protein [Haloprofundus salinisoli]
MRGQHTGRNYLGTELDGWPATELLEDDSVTDKGIERKSDDGLLSYLRTRL